MCNCSHKRICFCLYHMLPLNYIYYVCVLHIHKKQMFSKCSILTVVKILFMHIYVRILWIIGKHSFLTNKCVTQNSVITQLYILSVHCLAIWGTLFYCHDIQKCPFICILQFNELLWLLNGLINEYYFTKNWKYMILCYEEVL